jgi:leader peptidase (prepilin peptidase) / N-methyltransferase
VECPAEHHLGLGRGLLGASLTAAVATGFVLAVVAAFGLLIGSFLNVVVWRVPRGESVVTPPSACPKCGTRLRPYENIPVFSWLVLRGRCRTCRAPISVRYPLVESGTAILFVAVAVQFAGDPWAIPAYWYLAAIGLALALIDLDVHRLPDAIVKPAYVVGAVLLTGATVLGIQPWSALIRAGLGGVILYGFYFVLLFIYPKGMGWGDVKLAGVLGSYLGWIGWGSLVVGAFSAFLFGGVFSIGLVIFRGAGRATKIPFGPWMLLGAAFGIAAGEQVWQAYLGLLG